MAEHTRPPSVSAHPSAILPTEGVQVTASSALAGAAIALRMPNGCSAFLNETSTIVKAMVEAASGCTCGNRVSRSSAIESLRPEIYTKEICDCSMWHCSVVREEGAMRFSEFTVEEMQQAGHGVILLDEHGKELVPEDNFGWIDLPLSQRIGVQAMYDEMNPPKTMQLEIWNEWARWEPDSWLGKKIWRGPVIRILRIRPLVCTPERAEVQIRADLKAMVNKRPTVSGAKLVEQHPWGCLLYRWTGAMMGKACEIDFRVRSYGALGAFYDREEESPPPSSAKPKMVTLVFSKYHTWMNVTIKGAKWFKKFPCLKWERGYQKFHREVAGEILRQLFLEVPRKQMVALYRLAASGKHGETIEVTVPQKAWGRMQSAMKRTKIRATPMNEWEDGRAFEANEKLYRRARWSW